MSGKTRLPACVHSDAETAKKYLAQIADTASEHLELLKNESTFKQKMKDDIYDVSNAVLDFRNQLQNIVEKSNNRAGFSPCGFQNSAQPNGFIRIIKNLIDEIESNIGPHSNKLDDLLYGKPLLLDDIRKILRAIKKSAHHFSTKISKLRYHDKCPNCPIVSSDLGAPSSRGEHNSDGHSDENFMQASNPRMTISITLW
ncbi:MAG: hypothetical protein AAF702_43980 [Chloroflexota bacterium]